MNAVHVVVPDGIDDPARPSGGNTYDRRVCDGLRSLGWTVHEHPVPGAWPRPDAAALDALAGAVQRIPGGGVVLIDGLIASSAPSVLVPEAGRLHLIVLVHMPLGHRPADEDTRTREAAVLTAAAGVITTSAWSRSRLLGLYGLPPEQVHVARPGAGAADLAPGTASGGSLLCVAAVIFDKGHDLLLEALQSVSDLSWQCVCVGTLEREPEFAQSIRTRALETGLGDRISFTGPLAGLELERSYGAADLLVLASRAETYGMVVTEALAHGVPVLAAEVGGLTEALGQDAAGERPGLLVPPEDTGALAAGLRAWLGDAALRSRLRRGARQRRAALSGWSTTASAVAAVLTGAAR